MNSAKNDIGAVGFAKTHLPGTIITLLLIVLGAAAFFMLKQNVTLAAGRLIPIDAETVTISGGRLRGATALERLEQPESFDFIGCDVSPETIDDLLSAFPACTIIWDVPLHDGEHPSDASELTLPGATGDDLALLVYFPSLTRVDATGSDCYEALEQAQAQMPDCTFIWTVTIGGITASNTDAAIAPVSAVSMDELERAILALPVLESVDLRNTGISEEDAETLVANNTDIAFRRQITVLGYTFDSAAETIDLSRAEVTDVTALAQMLSEFSALRSVDLSGCDLSDKQVRQLNKLLPDVQLELVHSVSVFGQTVLSSISELDASEYPFTTPEEVMPMIEELPRLTKIDLSDCGLTNQQMEVLVSAYPDIKIVWTVQMGTHTLRTDATAFSTHNPSKVYFAGSPPEYIEAVRTCVRLTSEDIQVLKYCTDLVALDLGHNEIDDISILANLTDLKILILADNNITDLTPIIGLTKLTYIELFMNEIVDISPLKNMDELLDLNLCVNDIADFSPLYGLASLERLWYSHNDFNSVTAREISNALPNCECNHSSTDSTGGGWRLHERYFLMRAYFK